MMRRRSVLTEYHLQAGEVHQVYVAVDIKVERGATCRSASTDLPDLRYRQRSKRGSHRDGLCHAD